MKAKWLVWTLLGSITLSGGRAAAAAEGRPCGPEGELVAYGELITCDIGPVGDSDLFRFVGIAGEVVSIRAVDHSGLGSSPGVVLELLRPSDLMVVAANTGGGAAMIDFVLTETGEFTVRVSESGNDQAMTYTLLVDRLAPTSPAATPIAPAQTISNQMISPDGDADLFVFQGTSGDVVSLRATDLAGIGSVPSVLLELFRPDGTLVANSVAGGTAVIEDTLDQTGPYTLRVNEAGHDSEMTYNVEYQCLSGACVTLPRPRCDIGLNQETYTVGELVTADVFRIANPTANPVDIRLWLTIPGFAPPIPAGSVTIPPGFDQNFGPLPLFTITPEFPFGAYGFHCRMMSNVTGETLVIDLNRFDRQ